MKLEQARQAAGVPYSRIMPWRGRNERIIAAREAKPKLPPGWGSSFTRRADPARERRHADVTAPAPLTPLDELGRLATAGCLPERLNTLLHLLAGSGMTLPRPGLLAHALGRPSDQGEVSGALHALARRGAIQRWVGSGQHRGEAAILLLDTGDILRTALCPEQVSFP